MKSKEYVYTVVSSYRKAIDSYYEKVKYSVDEETLNKLNDVSQIIKQMFSCFFSVSTIGVT